MSDAEEQNKPADKPEDTSAESKPAAEGEAQAAHAEKKPPAKKKAVKRKAKVEPAVAENAHTKALIDKFGERITPVASICKESIVQVDEKDIVEVITYLKEECACDLMLDESSAHWPEEEKPFEVFYQFYSTRDNLMTRVKTFTAGTLPTMVPLYKTADWLEREIYDMMGIQFEGHPNLTRILLPDDWEGFPQRKDYPLGGIGQEEEIRSNVWERPGLRTE